MKLEEKYNSIRKLVNDTPAREFLTLLKKMELKSELYIVLKESMGRLYWRDAFLKFDLKNETVHIKDFDDFKIPEDVEIINDNLEEKEYFERNEVHYHIKSPKGGLFYGERECTEIGFCFKMRQLFEELL